MNRLQTIDADTLQSTAYEPVSFVVDDLLPQGLHLLAGAPKIGKSWLALWLCLCAAQGKPLWTFATRQCEVLYLCLEDSFQRIQSRLFDLTEDAPPTLHFAVMSQQLHNGLVEQIEQFLKEHPQTRLIVIDTLQRIRTVGNDANPYASDYRDIGVLKALADKHRIAILLVHHLRKMNDDDPMNMISGTTGLSGATDSNFVLRKSQRRENTATLYCTGRDIPYRELALEFDGEDHVWKLLSDDCEQKEQPNERILFLLSELLRRQPEISAPAKVLLEKIDPAGAEGLTPNSFSHRIRKSVDALRRNGITVSFRKSNGDRLICLKRVDGVDDPAAGNIVTIDPENARVSACEPLCARFGDGVVCVYPTRGDSAHAGRILGRHKNGEYAAATRGRPAFQQHEARTEGSDTTPMQERRKSTVCRREQRVRRHRAPTLRKPSFCRNKPRTGLFRHSHSGQRVVISPPT